MRPRNQCLVIESLIKVADDLPFAMLGVDSDSDTAFIPRIASCNFDTLSQRSQVPI